VDNKYAHHENNFQIVKTVKIVFLTLDIKRKLIGYLIKLQLVWILLLVNIIIRIKFVKNVLPFLQQFLEI